MLRMFENRVLGKALGPKVGNVIENCPKLNGRTLHEFYGLPNIHIFRSSMWQVRGRRKPHTMLLRGEI